MPHEEQSISANQDPDRLRAILELLAQAASPKDPREELLESLFAQQDATDVSNRVTGDQEEGSVRDFLAMLGETAIDFTPGIGDAKAIGLDAPEQFASGQNIAGIISILSAIPGLGFFGDLARRGGKGLGRGGAELTTFFDDVVAAGRTRDARGTVGQGTGRAGGDLEGIRSEIFQSLKKEDPFGDQALLHEKLIGQIEDSARRRGATPVTRADFNVSGRVDDALSNLRIGQEGLKVRDADQAELIEVLRRSLDELFGN
jgi:hypothetical protein